MMKFFILVATWWTLVSSPIVTATAEEDILKDVATDLKRIAFPMKYLNDSSLEIDPFLNKEISANSQNSTFNATNLIPPTIDGKNESTVIATADEAPSRKRNLSPGSTPSGPKNHPRLLTPRVPYKNPWNTYPGQGPPDYSPMYQGDSKYDLSKIHLLYLNSKPYGQCKKHQGRSAGPINMKPWVSEVRLQLTNQKIKEKDAYIKGHYIPARKPTADGRHQLTGILPSENDKFFEQENALFLEGLTIKYQNKLCLPPSEVGSYLPSIRVPLELKVPCSTKHNVNGGHGTPCRDSKYRTIDGSCNNLRYPFWGKSNVCHIRLLPAAYEDGVSKPRKSSYSGRNPLREPRDISINMLQDMPSSGSFYNSWHTTWGQYIIHDMTSTPQATADHDELIKCCPDKSKGQTDFDPAKCMPIFLAPNDIQANVRKCINFIRSAPCPLCTLGPRQQMNLATSFIDQSLMYGNDMDTLNGLRAHHDGLLKVKPHEKGDLLPDPDDPNTDQCSHPEKMNHICFKSGDIRVNQHPPLQLLHTLWVRRHNQHAKALAEANPSWRRNDEILFQEARRITIAETQHITYREYLPILLGPELIDYYGLDVSKSLYCNYDPYVNPTTINEFVTAAGRFGHSQVGNMFPQSMNISLKDNFFNPEAMRAGHCDFITAGLLRQSSNVVDPHFSTSIKNHLYAHRDKLKGFGGDLPTFNINRGRDHGIPPYFVFLKFCFNYEAKNWNDLRYFIEPEAYQKLTKIYSDFRDIDLYVGGISERKQQDADLGPTFACLLGLQFRALKYGDRYFYSHNGQSGSFTPSQLKDMKTKFSLANFLCLTSKNLQSVPKFAFLPPSKYNPIVPCEYYRKNGWLDHKLFASRPMHG